MRDLRTRLVIGFLHSTKQRFPDIRHRERQVGFTELAENMLRQRTPEHRARSNTPAIVAGEADNIGREQVEARQGVVGHADLAVPFPFELHIGDLQEKPRE